MPLTAAFVRFARWWTTCLPWVATWLVSFQVLAADAPPPLSPEESLRSMRPRPGIQIELVAAEPLVMDPIALDWGADGRLWVVEMADYPLGLDDQGQPGGRVRVLRDSKGTGRFDEATVFLDGLPFPTDIMAWGRGVLITAAPDLFYAEDTNGDGQADVRQVLYTGFAPGNQQHRINGLRYGLDNWIYLANGDSNGQIRSTTTEQVVNLQGRDLRIRPDQGLLDLQCGMTQYGRNRDAWGNWFGCNNSNPLWHFPLADQYLRRNPFVPPPPIKVTVAANQAVFPISQVISHSLRFKPLAPGQPGQFTSACSALIYQDDWLGAEYQGNVFICEPVHNLIHRRILERDGISFSSRRADDETDREFLASSDSWFRPTSVRTGPDGALWVTDIYRIVIEHPQWIDPQTTKALHLRAGHERGRIYRLFPANRVPPPAARLPQLDPLDTPTLAAAIETPRSWQREMVQRLLVKRQDQAAVATLANLALKSPRAETRLHALCTLEGLQALSPRLLIAASNDQHPGVRREALRLCEPWLDRSPELWTALEHRLTDDDAAVRVQLACSLGQSIAPESGQLLTRLAAGHPDDPWLRAAIASSWNEKNLAAVDLAVLPTTLAEPMLRTALGYRQRAVLAQLVQRLTATAAADPKALWPWTALSVLLEVLDDDRDQLLTDADRQRLDSLQATAHRLAADPASELPLRVAAIGCLARNPRQARNDAAQLTELVSPRQMPEVQTAALEAIGRLEPAQVPPLLWSGWPSYLPGFRAQVVDLLLTREVWSEALLQALEDRRVPLGQLDPAQRQRLLNHRQEALRRRAQDLFAATGGGTRQQVVAQYQDVLSLEPDLVRGKAAFAKRCAACHQLEGVGQKSGADLAGSKDKSPQALLISILDPNQAVEGRYLAYSATTTDGRSLTGLLTTETGTSITLATADGKQHVILRTELDELQNTGKSFMPEGLEVDFGKQALADVIAYLRAATAVAVPGPGNR